MNIGSILEGYTEYGNLRVSQEINIVCINTGATGSLASESHRAIGSLIMRKNNGGDVLLSWIVNSEGRHWEAKQLLVYHLYRVPSIPIGVFMDFLQCHSIVHKWLWEEKEYHPHRADIPRATNLHDMAMVHSIIRKKINGSR